MDISLTLVYLGTEIQGQSTVMFRLQILFNFSFCGPVYYDCRSINTSMRLYKQEIVQDRGGLRAAALALVYLKTDLLLNFETR